MTDVIGSAAFELRAVRDKLKGDLRQAEGDLKGFTDKAERDTNTAASGMGAGIARFASVAISAVTAVAAVLTVAATAAVNFSLAGIKMGSDISDAAKRVGIGTDALQEFRFVAQQTGEDAAAADQALESFGKKLAGAGSGLDKEALKSFAALRIDQDQIRSFETFEDALDETIDRISGLASEADRAAIAEKLGLGPLSTALKLGADDIAALRDEARTLGVVMDAELVQRAADAQAEFDKLSQVIDVQLKSAFVDLAPALIAALSLVVRLANAIGNLADRFRDFEDKSSRGLQAASVRLQAQVTANRNDVLRNGDRGILDRQGNRQAEAALARVNAEIAARARANIAADQRRRPPFADTGGTLSLPATERATRAAPAERIDRSAELEARRAQRVEDDIIRARQRLLGLAEDEADTAQQRYDTARASIAFERATRDADLARQQTAGEITAAELEVLAALNARADALEDRVLTDRAFREIDDERLATERLLSALATDLLSLQAGGARTAAERRRIELELLEIAQRERRDALTRELERRNATAAQRSAALGNLDRIDAAENGAVIRNTLSPLDRWRDESLRGADEVREAYEDVAARGLDALNDGIVDAIVNSRNLGEVFSNVARQIIADLAAIAVRRAIVEPLADMLFGGGSSSGGSGGGGFLSSALSFGSRFFGGEAAASAPGDNGGLLPGRLLGAPVMPIAGPKGSSMFASSSVPMAGMKPRLDVFVTSDDPKFRAFVREEAEPLAERAYSRSMTAAPKLTMSQTAQQQQHTVGRKTR